MAKENWLVIVEPKKKFKDTHRTTVVMYPAESKAEAVRSYTWDYGWSNYDQAEYKKPVAVRALAGVSILL